MEIILCIYLFVFGLSFDDESQKQKRRMSKNIEQLEVFDELQKG